MNMTWGPLHIILVCYGLHRCIPGVFLSKFTLPADISDKHTCRLETECRLFSAFDGESKIVLIYQYTNHLTVQYATLTWSKCGKSKNLFNY